MKYNITSDYESYLINSFQTIGWPDPFQDDFKCVKGSLEDGINLKIPTDTMDLVYDENRYFEESSPNFIYIPRKEVMLKIMRACIGLKNGDEFRLKEESQ